MEARRLSRKQKSFSPSQVPMLYGNGPVVSRETMEKAQEMIIHFLRFFHAEIPATSQPLHGRTWDTVFRGKPGGSAKAGPRFPWKSGERLPLMISGGFWREFSGLIFRCTGEAQPPVEIAIFCIPPLKILRAGGNQKTFPGPAVFLCLYSPEATDTVPKKKELRIEVSRLRRLTSIFNSQFFLVRRHLIPDEVSRSGKH